MFLRTKFFPARTSRISHSSLRICPKSIAIFCEESFSKMFQLPVFCLPLPTFLWPIRQFKKLSPGLFRRSCKNSEVFSDYVSRKAKFPPEHEKETHIHSDITSCFLYKLTSLFMRVWPTASFQFPSSSIFPVRDTCTPEVMSEQSVNDWIYGKHSRVQTRQVIQIQTLGRCVADFT